MKQLSALFVTGLLAAGAAFAQDQPKTATPPPAQPQTQAPAPAQGQTQGQAQGNKPAALEDRASYIIGLNLGQSLRPRRSPSRRT